ncbi:hypothetical protein GN376_21760 [Salmonella enterica]|nr:hypothetical protein SeSPB_B0157 [Salmonella enterica subsp. enterica serovar Saintpaul str. SARA29]EEK5518722.1 hypothetical protein [Salmonella enterica]
MIKLTKNTLKLKCKAKAYKEISQVAREGIEDQIGLLLVMYKNFPAREL